MSFINRKYLLLVLLPAIYLLYSGVFFVPWKPFYRIGPDPVYIYLLNGTTLASGNIAIAYVDNPGVPVQCFSAVVIYIKHLFNYNVPLYHDVLLHPESYLYAICTTISVLFSLIVVYTGYYVFKKTSNLAMALLFQLTPLIGKEFLIGFAPSPEAFIVMFGMSFIAYIYCNSIFINTQFPHKISFRNILIYAVYMGFLVSCKYTCFPLLFLILFLLPTFRSRIIYIRLFILFFICFIFPALPAWRRMVQWISGIATHTGAYGQGDAGFVHTSEFVANLINIFHEDIYFTSLYIAMCIFLLIAFIRRKQMQQKNRIYLRLLAGIWVLSFVLIILVAKHYSFHYLEPIRLCFPLIIVGSYSVFKDAIKIQLPKYKHIVLILFYIFLSLRAFTCLELFFAYPSRRPSHKTSDFLDKYHNTPLIITSDYKSSRIESSLYFGVAYTGDFRNQYLGFLKRTYPNSYLYKQSQNMIFQWDRVLYPLEIYSKFPKTVVYFNDKDSNQRKSIISHLSMWGKDTIAQCKLVYRLNEYDEYVYELEGKEELAKAWMAKHSDVNFDFEKTIPGKSKFISIKGKDTIKGTDALSNKEYHSGNNSILLTPYHQYAINYPIRAFPGNIIEVSIWRKSDDGKADIVLSSKSSADFYLSGNVVIDSGADGWQQIENKCLVPPSVKDSTIIVYLYYYGHGYAYFDDLSIKVYPMK